MGVLTGLFGVGGGFMIVPLLNLAFGVQYEVAVGSSLALTVGAGAAGTARHLRLKNVELKSVLVMGGSAVCGVLLGAMLQVRASSALGPQAFKMLMDGIFIVVLSLTAWVVLRSADEGRSGQALLQRLPGGPRIDLPGAKLSGVSLPGLCLIGLAIGVLTGMIGIGGGVLFMPLLIVVVGLGPRLAVGTSLGVVTFGSIAGTIKHGLLGHVSLMVAMSLLIGSAFGVLIGAHFCQRLHETRLRRFFAMLVMLVVVGLAIRFVFSMFV